MSIRVKAGFIIKVDGEPEFTHVVIGTFLRDEAVKRYSEVFGAHRISSEIITTYVEADELSR